MAAGVGSMAIGEDLAADDLGSGQIDDIFGDDDDIFNVGAPLPPLSPTNAEGQAADGAENEQDDGKKPKKKAINRSPQPRLDDARLCSDRGILALAHLCDGIKFKGKGHEAEDLNILMQKFEHWAHRLFPKFPFQDCVDQIESMGHKKLVQNTIKSVRRGESNEVKDNSDDENLANIDQDDEDAQSVMNDGNFGEQIQVETSTISKPNPSLTAEQIEQIRKNREKALAKRQQAKIDSQSDGISNNGSSQSSDSINQVNSSFESRELTAEDKNTKKPRLEEMEEEIADDDLEMGSGNKTKRSNGNEMGNEFTDNIEAKSNDRIEDENMIIDEKGLVNDKEMERALENNIEIEDFRKKEDMIEENMEESVGCCDNNNSKKVLQEKNIVELTESNVTMET